MKKLVILSFALLVGVAAQAQSIRIGIRGGLNLANQQIETEGLDLLNQDFDSEGRLSWQAGAVIDVGLPGMFAIQPAVLLSSKGYRFEENTLLGDFKLRAQPLYLHVPVPILVRVGVANMKAFVGAGPYVSFGVGGKVETEGDVVGFDFANDGSIEWGDDNGDTFRSTDSGLILMGGIEYSGIQLALSYELGLANIASNGDEDNITRNRTLSLTATYFLFD